MNNQKEPKEWEKPELISISAGGVSENILSGSGVPRGTQRSEPDFFNNNQNG